MGVCFEKSGADPFFLKKLEKKGRMDFMSNQKKKGERCRKNSREHD